jgi:type VI protein secretion system component VasK
MGIYAFLTPQPPPGEALRPVLSIIALGVAVWLLWYLITYLWRRHWEKRFKWLAQERAYWEAEAKEEAERAKRREEALR